VESFEGFFHPKQSLSAKNTSMANYIEVYPTLAPIAVTTELAALCIPRSHESATAILHRRTTQRSTAPAPATATKISIENQHRSIWTVLTINVIR
jgi:hypothetical protein